MRIYLACKIILHLIDQWLHSGIFFVKSVHVVDHDLFHLRLFPFPTQLENPNQRDKRRRLVNRESRNNQSQEKIVVFARIIL